MTAKKLSTKKSVLKSSLRTNDTASPLPAPDFFRAGAKLAGSARVAVDGHVLTFTHLDKVYWPQSGYTKGDVLRYYYSMAEYVLPYLKDRPLILKRYPEGITKPFFYQHDLKDTPSFVRREKIASGEGAAVHYAIANDRATLLYLVNLGTIAQNPFHSRMGHLEHPDYFIFDLDPEMGASFKSVCQIALLLRDLLEELGLKSYAKTSGSTGVHIYVPIKSSYSYTDIVPFSKSIARRITEMKPAISTIERMTRNRKKGQVYIDYLQNVEGKSVASAYSVREKPGATVSTPLSWKEVEGTLAISDFNIANIAQRVKKKGDLFKEVLTKKQSLGLPMKRLAAW